MIKSQANKKLSSATRPIWFAFYCSLFFIAIVTYKFYRSGEGSLGDDAYYYLIIAKNIVNQHISTFDGQSLTNGYHPLWMALLILQYAIAGSNIYVTLAIQIIILGATLYFLLLALNCDDFLSSAIFSLAYIKVIEPMAIDGMETPLWALCFALLVHAAARLRDAKNKQGDLAGSLIIGSLATAGIAARIDSAVFILPFALLAPPNWRGRLTALSIIGVFGLAYAVWSQLTFGMPVPISGAVKSLGGFQVNWRLVNQLTEFNPENGWWKVPFKLLLSPTWEMVALWIASPFLISLAPRGSVARPLLIAYIVGLFAYSIKLLFFSSWMIWGWYNFPLLIGVVGALYVILPLLAQKLSRIDVGLSANLRRAAAALLAFAPIAFLLVSTKTAKPDNFIAINRLAVTEYADVLKDQRVAMGDRAGSFAFFYKGPVTQLEGLANDKEYFEQLSSKGDIKALLCRRGVKYLVAFSSDLGNDYSDHEINLLLPNLTQFHGPTLRVSHAQEVGKAFDFNKLNFSGFGPGDNYLYIWRLDCPSQAA